jgi:hypothetical protein
MEFAKQQKLNASLIGCKVKFQVRVRVLKENKFFIL